MPDFRDNCKGCLAHGLDRVGEPREDGPSSRVRLAGMMCVKDLGQVLVVDQAAAAAV